ncbi:uncharacterized protein MYCFIDRAFT_174588 [Pseudocercospora fijiensis CIRAD86]|uniref:non-specific serine/threonine protein kinase n=1 Tax=Pseudocercospora fijiensis (strain CIRAD86) TaxID=383855 RepID=M3B140_PSEFD|nr:uncharacterized protein MYCFIDRAFT_174588 [Pseudocercospora fijiensis CIRAD86]EME83108.1 hypothetical protein MYCFIDRAFT_174588 [Pseudocercospora fijiensis CIRAD86]
MDLLLHLLPRSRTQTRKSRSDRILTRRSGRERRGPRVAGGSPPSIKHEPGSANQGLLIHRFQPARKSRRDEPSRADTSRAEPLTFPSSFPIRQIIMTTFVVADLLHFNLMANGYIRKEPESGAVYTGKAHQLFYNDMSEEAAMDGHATELGLSSLHLKVSATNVSKCSCAERLRTRQSPWLWLRSDNEAMSGIPAYQALGDLDGLARLLLLLLCFAPADLAAGPDNNFHCLWLVIAQNPSRSLAASRYWRIVGVLKRLRCRGEMPPKSRAAKAKANGTEDVSPAPSALGKRPRTGIAEGSQTAVPPPDPDVASAIVEADDQREEPPVKKKRKKKGSSQAAAGAGIARGASTTAKAALSSSKKPLATAPAPKRKLSRELDGLKDGRSEPDASAYGRDSSDTEGKRRSKRLNKAVPPASNVQQLPLPVIVEEEEQEENGPSRRSANGGQQAPLAQNSHDPGAVIEGDVDDQPQDPVSRRATSPRSTPSSNRRDKEGLDASREDLRNFRPAAPIDFSTIDVEEIYRNFAPYGGGRLQPHSSEKEVRERYERENPSVRYTDSNQIPPDPREPKDPSDGDGDGDRGLKLFAPIEPKYAVRARTNDAKARWHDDGWDTVWSTLRAHNPPDRIYEMYDYCWRDSCQLRDRAYFADIPDWPAGTLPSAFFPQVRRAVEVAMMESLVPQWKEQIVLTGQQFGDAGARDLEQKLAAMKNGVGNGTKRPDIPRDNDMFEAEWAGRLQQFAQGSLGPLRESTRRTQHRLKAAHRRALKIRSDYDIRVRPPILNDGVIHTSMEHYCNRLHVILRQTLIDYIKPVWPPAPRSPRTTDRYNRMIYRVVQGQNPYPPGQASPKELDFVDIATKEIGFDHVRSQQDPGRWEYREHLGSGSFDRWESGLAIKDTYLASTKGLGLCEETYGDFISWYKDKNDKIPKEYAALAMLNSCESSANIVHCRAYSVYDERGMYRLYTEYCGHNDLEYTIDRYRTLAMLNADMAAIGGTSPEQAVLTTSFSSRIPDRVLWCILEALSSAACLMDLGYIPTGDPDTDTPPPNFQQMLHRDIKPLNIFLSTPRSDNHWPKIPTPKLGDFGGVIFCDEPEASTQIYGTRCYTSPEVLRRGIPHPITPKADIWAIGRVMLSLINLNFQDDHELLSRESEVDFVKTPDFKAGAEEGRHPLLCELIRNCLNPLPADRPTAKELWMRVWREVGVEEPMTRIRWEEDEMLMFESDKYEAFASNSCWTIERG